MTTGKSLAPTERKEPVRVPLLDCHDNKHSTRKETSAERGGTKKKKKISTSRKIGEA